MSERKDKPKRPSDINQLAKSVVDAATLDEDGLQKLREKIDRDQTPGNRGDSPKSGKGKS